MQRFTMRVALASLAAGVVIAPVQASPAAAASDGLDNIIGGCQILTNASESVSDSYTGVMYDYSATLDGDTPTYANVSCAISIDGVIDTDTESHYSGPFVQYGVNSLSFKADQTQLLDVCQRVQYGDGYDTGWVCPGLWDDKYLPPEGDPLLLLDPVNAFLALHVDPVVCPVLAAHPGDYGPISIKSDGDVYPNALGYNGAPLYDCPPYNNF